MGILILGAIMIAVAFVFALAVAGFFAYHFWKLQAAYERDHLHGVNLLTGKVPYDHQPPQQGEHAVRAFDDSTEAMVEQAVARQLPDVLLEMQR